MSLYYINVVFDITPIENGLHFGCPLNLIRTIHKSQIYSKVETYNIGDLDKYSLQIEVRHYIQNRTWYFK